MLRCFLCTFMFQSFANEIENTTRPVQRRRALQQRARGGRSAGDPLSGRDQPAAGGIQPSILLIPADRSADHIQQEGARARSSGDSGGAGGSVVPVRDWSSREENQYGAARAAI